MAQGHTASETGQSRTWVSDSLVSIWARMWLWFWCGSYKDTPGPNQNPPASHTYKMALRGRCCLAFQQQAHRSLIPGTSALGPGWKTEGLGVPQDLLVWG